jgi:hypothetical protein
VEWPKRRGFSGAGPAEVLAQAQERLSLLFFVSIFLSNLSIETQMQQSKVPT